MKKPAQGPDTGDTAHAQALEELKLREMWARQRLKLVEKLAGQLKDRNAALGQAMEELGPGNCVKFQPGSGSSWWRGWPGN